MVPGLSIGGVSRVVLELCKKLQHEKYEVHLISLSNRLDILEYSPLPEVVQLHVVPYSFSSGYSSLSYLRNSFFLSDTKNKAKYVINVLTSLAPDIIHFHTLPRELTIGIVCKAILDTELVFTDHLVRIGKDDYRPVSRKLLIFAYRRLYRKYHLISCSKAVAAANQRCGFINSQKKHLIIDNQIDTNEWKFVDRSTKNEKFVTVIYVARINAVKGHMDLLKAWKIISIQKKNVRLILVGPDDMRGKVQQFASKNHLMTSVNFLGARSDIQNLLVQADIAVFPSHKEGLPIALLEKMATGLPVVASDIPELKNIVEHEANGLLYPCGNSEALVQQLNKLIESKELRIRLGQKSRLTIEKYFSEDTVKLHEDLYQSLIG